MKEFLFKLLQNLDKLCGLKQYEKLCAMENGANEVKELIDVLCNTCNQFPYIPDNAKQTIISGCVIADPEFIGLNAKVVFKWLSANKGRYFKEESHQPVEPVDEPLTGEARAARIKEFLEAHNRAVANAAPEPPRENYYDTIRNDWMSSDGTKYHAPKYNVALLQDLKIQYGREHTDRSTGARLAGHPTFDEWIESLQEPNEKETEANNH